MQSVFTVRDFHSIIHQTNYILGFLGALAFKSPSRCDDIIPLALSGDRG